LQIAIGLVISSIYVTGKYNAVGILGITLKNERMRYMICLRGHTTSDGGTLDSTQAPNNQKKIRSTKNHLLDLGKKLW